MCGAACTRCCWSACRRRRRSTGREPPSTAPASEPKGGRGDRPQPDGSWQAGHQASPRHGRPRHAAGPDTQRRQPPRQSHVGRHPGCRTARSDWRTGTLSPQAPQTARRQGLRSSPLPPGVPRPGRQSADCPARHREQPKARQAQVGHRANLRLAEPLPPSCHPLRMSRRHPPGLHHTRLRPRLSQPDPQVLLGALKPQGEAPPPCFRQRDGCRSGWQKAADMACDLLVVRFQGEVAGVEQMHLRLRQIALVGLGACRQEVWVILAPDRQ